MKKQIPVDLNLYEVYSIGTATISKNLKDLLDKCGQHPNEFCIATPHHNKVFDPNSECIDFIIAKK